MLAPSRRFWIPASLLALTLASLATLLPSATKAGPTETLTLIATNDVHGAVDHLAAFGGIVKAHREALGANLLLLDAGDQFQGTLISNHDEGETVFNAYAALGYTAIITGNHDYDFGPIGWLEDQVRKGQVPVNDDEGPRGALLRLTRKAPFPVLSANTWKKDSFKDVTGNPALASEIQSSGCKRPTSALPLDFTTGVHPEFLRPSMIQTLPSGIRVGIFGIDHALTPSMTTASNVSDLCFEDELQASLRTLDELSKDTDIRLLVIHGGDTPGDKAASELTRKILEARPGGVQAVLAGHTHFTHLNWVSGVPVIQSGANGTHFGRLDLLIDLETRKLVPHSIKAAAGIPISLSECGRETDRWCTQTADGEVLWNGVKVLPDPTLQQSIESSREALRPLASRALGEVHDGTLTRDRIEEASLTNVLTDALRALSGAELALLNTGGIRADLPQGPLHYETFFRVVPFGNRAVLAGPMPWPKLKILLQRSIETCGQYGALLGSGLRVEFSRDCGIVAGQPTKAVDPEAKLLRVTLFSGEVLLDSAAGLEAKPDRTFTIATLDFLLSGGSNYGEFVGTPWIADLGIFRELVADHWEKNPLQISPAQALDSRWKQIHPSF